MPNGKVQFVVFRRDMASNAPEKVDVRVIVSRDLHESEVIADHRNTWTILETAFEMKVAPIEGHPATILIRNPAADFALPVGRYALVIKLTAYDFVVVGPDINFER